MNHTFNRLQISIVMVLILFNTIAVANAITSTSEEPLIVFEKIIVEENPVPNEPFEITATVSTPARHSDLFLYIKVPNEISILSPIVAELDATKSGMRSASWILLASEAGSFPINIIATSNSPPETTTFEFDLSVGTQKSLIVTDVEVPGNLIEKDTFSLGIRLKNSGIINDTNIIIWTAIPDGLQLMGSGSLKEESLGPGEEITFRWDIKALKQGAFPVTFYYSSRNAGSHSLETFVNIGSPVVVDIQSTGFFIGGMNTTEASIIPGEKNLSIIVTFQNTGNTKLYGISAELLLEYPFSNPNSHSVKNDNNDEKFETGSSSIEKSWIGQLGVGQVREARFNVDVVENAQPGLHAAGINVYFSDGGENYNQFVDFLVKVTTSPLKIGSVSVADPPGYSGDVATQLDVELLNTGTTMYDVNTKLNLPDGFSPSWGNSDEVFFGNIRSSEQVTATYFIDIGKDLSPGEYPLTISIVSEEIQNSILELDFIVHPKATFKIFDVDDSQLYRGAINVPFKITFQNTAIVMAENVKTKLLGGNTIPGVKSSQITSVGDEENIGNVLPGQTFTTTFLVSLDPNVDVGDLTTFVEVSWEKDFDSFFIQNVNVPYYLSSGPSYLLYYQGIPLTYVIVLVGIIVALFYFSRVRKRKLKSLEISEVLEEKTIRESKAK